VKQSILYYDCFSGISGDMNISALVGLGVPEAYLQSELKKLNLPGWKLVLKEDSKNGIFGLRADVLLEEAHEHHHHHEHEQDSHEHLHHEHEHEHHDHDHHHHGYISHENHRAGHHHRNLADIRAIIEASGIKQNAKTVAASIFELIAKAEAIVHNTSPEEVHFHEVGALDSIIDIAAAAICIDNLNPDLVMASTIELGGGFVRCQHGLIPVPAPATVEILKGVKTRAGRVQHETTTPTGAAILASLVDEFSDTKNFTILKTAYGVGHRDMEIPNLLRVHWAERDAGIHSATSAKIPGFIEVAAIQIECNIDDMNPELHGYVMEKLFDAGASDVWLTPIIMKKNRSAMTLSALCNEAAFTNVINAMMTETSTFGLRYWRVDKLEFARDSRLVSTSLGQIRLKSAMLEGKTVKTKPEYEDVKKAAEKAGLPLIDAYRILAKELE